MIKAIIFDMGGVILVNKVEKVYEKLAEMLKINYQDLKDLQQKHKEDILSGRMSSARFEELVKKEFKLNYGVIKKWREAYLAVMSVNEELLSLAKKLKKEYKIAVISNIPDLHAQINKERNIFSYFNPCLISCEIGLIKPQKEIFELSLKKLKLKANECIFIDDREEHLNIPKNMGFHIIYFKNNRKLIKDLKALGVTV